jgi:hypothetical protein
MDQSTRVRRPHRRQDEIAQLVSEYAASGLSRSAFCQKHQLALATLARYLQQAGAAAVAPTNTSSFVAVELSAASGALDSGVALVLPSGRRLAIQRGFCPDTLQQVLSVLERG